MKAFEVVSRFSPSGDQPAAIEQLVRGLRAGEKHQVLLGVTGSGKTFTMANVIAALDCPTLVLSPNKILAAQLYAELKAFFPKNAVEYFISYYDYYQPEAYVPQSDTYIEKDASINDHIDRLRLKATSSLLERRDVIVVASVSAIYGLGSPREYKDLCVGLEVGAPRERDDVTRGLVDIQYERNEIDFSRGKFRVKGDVVDIFPAYLETALRVEFEGGILKRLREINPLTGETLQEKERTFVYPAKHFVTTGPTIDRALEEIRRELSGRLAVLRGEGKLLEAQRLEQRTRFDMEMMKELGFCHGIENYSRPLSGRKPGERPACLFDYFPSDYLVVIDESHVTVPQIGGMYEGDRSRKQTLVDYGFRLPSALDNRPLKFPEFEALVPRVVYVSATPGPYELKKTGGAVVEQVIRPTGLVDPEVLLRPIQGQVEDLVGRLQERVKRRERVLVTTLTKKTAEDLSDYLEGRGLRVRYLHSDIESLRRIEILKDLRRGTFDVLVGINLLREGLDLPEVSLVAVLDADKEGFLRSETTLIQVCGRAARNVNGQVVLYADKITGSMERAMGEMDRRRKKQLAHNAAEGITPKTIVSAVHDLEEFQIKAKESQLPGLFREAGAAYLTRKELPGLIKQLETQMREAAEALDYELAAVIRDKMMEIKDMMATGRGVRSGPAAKGRGRKS
ncbi:MAG TPA: excinuclease ABC subunit UvrB [Elusimicrobiota bacterium]|nr:excinuclease ABC subunit UvrB [Elusimicrobiota bacterium]HMX42363.1 excinuclease ABC subunit UvrB [Elusimicrobiota bacterium]HNC73866.1 excinuclease ABC subunit UvrB [Elusimicrobiota bacterium]HND63607.1 excinuclease ABC subunit UvrB [Elusimicrobiota bacterium]